MWKFIVSLALLALSIDHIILAIKVSKINEMLRVYMALSDILRDQLDYYKKMLLMQRDQEKKQ